MDASKLLVIFRQVTFHICDFFLLVGGGGGVWRAGQVTLITNIAPKRVYSQEKNNSDNKAFLHACMHDKKLNRPEVQITNDVIK